MTNYDVQKGLDILDNVKLKLTMFGSLIAHYPPEEGLGEEVIQGINVFVSGINQEIAKACFNLNQSVKEGVELPQKEKCQVALVKK